MSASPRRRTAETFASVAAPDGCWPARHRSATIGGGTPADAVAPAARSPSRGRNRCSGSSAANRVLPWPARADQAAHLLGRRYAERPDARLAWAGSLVKASTATPAPGARAGDRRRLAGGQRAQDHAGAGRDRLRGRVRRARGRAAGVRDIELRRARRGQRELRRVDAAPGRARHSGRSAAARTRPARPGRAAAPGVRRMRRARDIRRRQPGAGCRTQAASARLRARSTNARRSMQTSPSMPSRRSAPRPSCRRSPRPGVLCWFRPRSATSAT